MESNTNEYHAERKEQEQKLEALLLERLRSNDVTDFDINQFKAVFERTRKHGIEHLKNKAELEIT